MKALVAASLAAGMLFAAPAAFASQELASKKACLACHALDAKRVGPAYKDVAAKYAGQADAVEKLTHSILEGSKGKWAPPGVKDPELKSMMAPNKRSVSAEEAKQLAEWVLTIK